MKEPIHFFEFKLDLIKFRNFIIGLLILYSGPLFAQMDTSKSNLSFSGYAEVFYCYDMNQPANHKRPNFIYNHNRHNEFNLNLGFIKASYSKERIRANCALGSGTYVNSNYASEPGVLKNVYESNIGVKLSKKKNIWLDAGVFSSHIGFESSISKDCWSLTRSILAENSPYYESGLKITYTSDSSKWILSALLLNGWQHIQRPNGNNTPAFGSQITYTPNTKFTLNYSTFVGNEKPDTAFQMRYFHNFYGMFHISKKIHLTAGFDLGMEQKSKGSSAYNTWYSPVLIAKFILNDKWSISGRAEYYSDENGVIISTGTSNDFQTMGYSLNLDYYLAENAVWRIEGRMLQSKDAVFVRGTSLTDQNNFFTTSLAISF